MRARLWVMKLMDKYGQMFLFLTRCAYLMGLFGPDRPKVVKGAKKTQ